LKLGELDVETQDNFEDSKIIL